MGITIRCDQMEGREFLNNLGSDICTISSVKWEVTAIACGVLLAVNIYLIKKWRYRSHKTLLTFHNLRAAVSLLLLSINTLELARALLPSFVTSVSDSGNVQAYEKDGNENNLSYPPPASSAVNNVDDGQLQRQHETEVLNDHVTIVIGNALIWNALAAIVLTMVLILYHRVVELKKICEFLYVSATLEGIIFIMRIYELAEIVYERSIFELEPMIQSLTALCLLGLAFLDGLTIYKERYRPDYLEDYDKIGYRHTLATFYSKMCFWWLNPLLWFGYKEPLELEDLGQMRVEDSARAHYDRFLLIYTTKVKNNDRPPSLWLCYIKFCWRTFALGGILKLFGDLFALIGPLAIQQIVQYIEIVYGLRQTPKNNESTSISSSNSIENDNNSNNNNLIDSNGGNGNSKNNNNNSSITLEGFKDQLYGSLISGSRSLLQYVARNANKKSIAYEIGTRVGGRISIRATGTNWFEKSPADDYYDDYGDDVVLSNNNNGDYNNDYDDNGVIMVASNIGSGHATDAADVDSLSFNASGTDVKIYYPTWLDLLSNGWVIAWIVLLAALAQGALSQASTHILNMTGIRIKTSLQGLIYRKTLLLNASCIDVNEAHGNGDQIDTERKSHEKAFTTENQENIDDADDDDAKIKGNDGGGAGAGIEARGARTNEADNKTNNCQSFMFDKEYDVDGSRNVGAITNLMSEDTLNIMSFFWIAHYVWAIPLKIAVVMYLLYLKLGISAVIGSFVCILTMTPLQFLIGKAMSNNTETMASYTDKRLKRIHETFVGIKLIKLNAWDDVFLRKIGEARAKELKYLNKDSIYWTLMTILTHISTVLITFVTLSVYTILERTSNDSNFTASHLFSALALFQQLTVPLLIFPITVPIIISAVISTKRLERFLYAREIQKQFEGIRNMARILSKSDASLDMYEIKDKSASLPANITGITSGVDTLNSMNPGDIQEQNKLNERLALKINVPGAPAPLAHSEPQTPLSLFESTIGFNFQRSLHDDSSNKSLQSVHTHCKWQEPREKRLSVQRRELLRNTPYVVIRPRKVGHNNVHTAAAAAAVATLSKKRSDSLTHREALLLKMPGDMAVSVKQATFAWNPQRMEHVLHIRDISIPRGRLTIIVGKNGSGKSSLLAAMLMEMPLVSGDMIWNKTSTIAYVPQQPWLLNASIRENILFGESFRPKRYDFVLEACALKPDIELMPDTDQTVIGERGINLSGGQRQRVAIARALYSSANVVIMDDPLSSLDNAVARHIFEQSIKKMLLKANRTVLLVTQQLQLVQQADYLIVMKDGCLQASGTYKEIEINYPHIITKWNSIIARANEQQQQEQQSENNQLGRTARERWKLFKNVTRIGLQRSISASAAASDVVGENEGSAASFNKQREAAGYTVYGVDEDEDEVLPASSHTSNPLRISQSLGNFTLSRTRSSIYGSRHLIYDVPLPIDECHTEDVIMRRHRRGHSQRLTRQQSLEQRRQLQKHSKLQRAQTQNQQNSDSVRTSWNSSRFSGLSNVSAELRQSLVTAGNSSAYSCGGSNNSMVTILDGISGDASACQERQERLQSWQPQSSSMHHTPVMRNISLPVSLSDKQQQNSSKCDTESESSEDISVESHTTESSQADMVADLVKSSKADGGFQQFLRRMSMRRSYKPTAGSVHHRIHRPVSASNSILSISEETSTTPTTPITPTPAPTPTSSRTPMATAAELIVESNVFSAEKELVDNELQAESSHSNDSCIGNNQQPELELEMMDATDYKILANKGNPIGAGMDISVLLAKDDATKIIKARGSTLKSEVTVQTTSTSTSKSTTMAKGATMSSPSSPSSSSSSSSLRLSQSAIVQPHAASIDAERKYGKISSKIYLLYLRASGIPIVLIFFISALIWQCLRVYTDVWLQHWTDGSDNVAIPYETTKLVNVNLSTFDERITKSKPKLKSETEVTYYFRVYAIISFVCILMAMISTPAGQLAGCNARRQLHDKLLETIMCKSLYFFQITPLGRIMNRFTYDMAIIDKKIAATSQRLLQFTLLCLCAILINVTITPWFILLTLPICGAYYAIQKFYRCSSRELQRIDNATNSPVISHLSETIQGVTTIRAYNQEARFTEILFKRLEANTIAFTILNTSNRWLGISLDYLGGVIVFVAIVTALVAVNISGNAYNISYDDNNITNSNGDKINFSPKQTPSPSPTPSPSLVGLAINYTLLIPIYLNWVVKLLADMEMYVGSVERIAYYADPKAMMRDRNAESKNHDDAADDDGDGDGDGDAEDDNKDSKQTSSFANLCWRRSTSKTENHKKINVYDAAVAHDKLSKVCHKTDVDVFKFRASIIATQNAFDEIKHNSCSVANSEEIHSPSMLTIIESNEAERRASVQRLVMSGKRYKSVPISWPQRGDISFENVSIRYEGQKEDVIKNLTLKIPAGQRIGICGRTGSGKSSLALSLFGVLQTTSGRICIDEVDITQIHPDEIRTRLSIIPQDVHLFSATIRENLDPPGYYSDLALWNCLEMAQLKEFVNVQLPHGLDTEITDGGRNLSAGHRQLFCLARAILRGSVCLVLDEATSSLDSTVEKALLSAAHRAFQGRTIITIAHRLSTILDYDRIIVLENGKIVEDGRPHELQSRPDGIFNALLHSGRPLSATLSESGVVLQELMQHV